VPGVSLILFWSKLARRADIAGGELSFATFDRATCLGCVIQIAKRSAWSLIGDDGEQQVSRQMSWRGSFWNTLKPTCGEVL